MEHNTHTKNQNYVIGLVVSILLLIPSVLLASRHELTGVQASIFHAFNNASDVFKVPALIITNALGAAYPIVICIVVPLLFKRFRLAWRFFVVVGGSGVLMVIIKKLVAEPRPAALLHGNLHQRAIETGLNSYPSGHEVVATAMALTLWMILPRQWRWLAIVWIVIVGISRVYLGVHSLNDIVGGFAIGLVSICVLRLLPRRLLTVLHLDKEDALLEPGF